MNEKESFLKSGLIEEYVLGLSNASDKARVELMAERHEEVADLLQKTRQAMEHYCRSSREQASREIKDHLLNAMRSKSQRQQGVIRPLPTYNQKPNLNWVATTAIVLSIFAITFAIVTINKNSRLKRDLLVSQSANDDMMARMNSMMSKHKGIQSKFNLLQDLNTRMTPLNGFSDSNKAMAVIYWNQNKQEALMHIVNLPKSPPGMTYQLWANVEGEMKDMGVISNSVDWISLPFFK